MKLVKVLFFFGSYFIEKKLILKETVNKIVNRCKYNTANSYRISLIKYQYVYYTLYRTFHLLKHLSIYSVVIWLTREKFWVSLWFWECYLYPYRRYTHFNLNYFILWSSMNNNVSFPFLRVAYILKEFGKIFYSKKLS